MGEESVQMLDWLDFERADTWDHDEKWVDEWDERLENAPPLIQ
jgi:hypothetical protein